MEFLNSIQQVKSNWQPYKKWEAEQNDKEFQRQELYKKVPVSKEELEKASQYGRTLIDSINVMDQYSINKAEDVEMTSKLALSSIEGAIGFGELGLMLLCLKTPKIKKYVKNIENLSANEATKIVLIPTIASMILPLTIMPFFNIKFASYEKEASRIARYQAREDELKDPENFVIYNEEQIKEAKKIAKTLPNPPDKKKKSINPATNYSEAMKSIKILMQDHENYLKWKEEHLKNEKNKVDSFNTMNPTPEQMQKARRDQDNLLRIIRKIEINSQNYLNNVEMACNMGIITALAIGAAGGGIISGITKLLQKFKLVSASSKSVNTLSKVFPILGALGLTFATASYTVKAKKEAAKIGRFKAKQELLSDPHNFVTYSDEQLESVKELKAPQKAHKNLFDKFNENYKFLFQLKKDYEEYKNYEKTEYKEEQKLQEALKQINVSDKQMEDAKFLQKNAFMTFEKLDEMTQRYVDDTDAATDIAKKYLNSISNLVGMSISLFLMSKPIKGAEKMKDFILKFIPMFAPILVQIPAEIKAINIKKEAGKIGTMKAIQDLQDPRHFINEDR